MKPILVESKKNLTISDHLGHHKKICNPQQLGYYLAGLIEGDGSFGYAKLEIVFHMKDKSAAYQLRTYLGYGSVYDHGSRQAARFVISNKAGLKHVIDLVNGKLVSPIKVAQLKKNNYESQLHLTILPPSKNIVLTNHWLAGFIDADGSLGIFIAYSQTHKQKKSVRLEVKFSQKDDCLVNLIADMFEIKKVYKHPKTQIHILNITASVRIKTMIDYLDNYHLQTKKYTQYCIFRRCYRFMQAKKHLLPDGLKIVKSLKTRLQNVYK